MGSIFVDWKLPAKTTKLDPTKIFRSTVYGRHKQLLHELVPRILPECDGYSNSALSYTVENTQLMTHLNKLIDNFKWDVRTQETLSKVCWLYKTHSLIELVHLVNNVAYHQQTLLDLWNKFLSSSFSTLYYSFWQPIFDKSNILISFMTFITLQHEQKDTKIYKTVHHTWFYLSEIEGYIHSHKHPWSVTDVYGSPHALARWTVCTTVA